MKSKLSVSNLHGTLMKVHGLGVLITGKSQSGKSLLALALIDRGHQFLGDDLIEIKLRQDKVIGSCPSLSENFLYLNPVGLINIRKMYGKNICVSSSSIDLIIELRERSKKIKNELPAEFSFKEILGQKISYFPLTTTPYNHLLVETLVNLIHLKKRGYHGERDFLRKQQQQLMEQSSQNYVE